MDWIDPPNFVAGEVVTAEMLDALSNNLRKLTEPDTWDVTWTAATTPPSLGNGALIGSYVAVPGFTMLTVALTFGSTTSAGSGLWKFSLPQPIPASTPRITFPGHGYDSSANASYSIMAIGAAGNQEVLIRTDGTTAGGAMRNAGGPNVPFAWDEGDVLQFNGIYMRDFS